MRYDSGSNLGLNSGYSCGDCSSVSLVPPAAHAVGLKYLLQQLPYSTLNSKASLNDKNFSLINASLFLRLIKQQAMKASGGTTGIIIFTPRSLYLRLSVSGTHQIRRCARPKPVYNSKTSWNPISSPLTSKPCHIHYTDRAT
jgi:hypothetical protein